MGKREELTDIANQLMELYPHLDGVIIEGSVEEPSRIVFVPREEVYEIAEEQGYDMDEVEAEDGVMPLLDFYSDEDDDDEGNGGMFH